MPFGVQGLKRGKHKRVRRDPESHRREVFRMLPDGGENISTLEVESVLIELP